MAEPFSPWPVSHRLHRQAQSCSHRDLGSTGWTPSGAIAHRFLVRIFRGLPAPPSAQQQKFFETPVDSDGECALGSCDHIGAGFPIWFLSSGDVFCCRCQKRRVLLTNCRRRTKRTRSDFGSCPLQQKYCRCMDFSEMQLGSSARGLSQLLVGHEYQS